MKKYFLLTLIIFVLLGTAACTSDKETLIDTLPSQESTAQETKEELTISDEASEPDTSQESSEPATEAAAEETAEEAMEVPESLDAETMEMPSHVQNYPRDVTYDPDPLSGTIQVDGVTYQFPVPMIVFMENGWDYTESSAEYYRYDATEPGEDTEIRLQKDGKLIEVRATNYDAEYMPNEYCYVYVLRYNDDDFDEKRCPEVILPGNVSIFSPVEEIKEAWKEYDEYLQKDSEKEVQTSNVMSYRYSELKNDDRIHTYASVHYINNRGKISISGSYSFAQPLYMKQQEIQQQ